MRANLMFAAVILSLVCLASASWKWGPCPAETLQTDFDLSQYLGKWREAARLESIPFETGDCVYADYSLKEDGMVRVENTEILPDGEINNAIGKAYQTKKNPAYLRVSFFWIFYGDYKVIETDYSDYSVVYSCSNWGLAHYQYAWILTRNNNFKAGDSDQIATLEKLGIDRSELIIHDLNECPTEP